MKKKGQVYILAAIILAIVLFSLAAIKNKFEQKEIRGDFEALAENYQIEAARLINSAMQSEEEINIHEAFKSFSTMFTAYAKGKNPRYGLIYVLGLGNKIQITNFLDREISIQGCDSVLGEDYTIKIPGGFREIPADLNFEDFNIQAGIVPADFQFDCGEIDPFPPVGGGYESPNFCIFIPSAGTTDLAVVVDGTPYYLCVEMGVPELMQVSLMQQGEQAKVRGTGKCINQDFCGGFDTQYSCEDTCGKDVCCWWGIAGGGGKCLSNYSYTARCSGVCMHEGDQFCYDEYRIYYYDSCREPEVEFKDCREDGPDYVCRDETNKAGLDTQCCEITDDNTDCYGDDIYYLSSCGTYEGVAETCATGFECRNPGTGPECCELEYETKCDGNDIYYYSDCGTKEDFVQDCTSETFDVCRDPYYTGGGTLPDEAVCCLQNFEQKCSENYIYMQSSCGTNEGLVEECDRFCSTQTNECCEQLSGQVCSDDLTKICEYHDKCGNKADCDTDCGDDRFCSTQTNECCEQLSGQVCSDDLTKICEYHDECGNKADCDTDCGAQGKTCECDHSGCECKQGKIFTCRKYYTATDCDDIPSCASGWTPIGDPWVFDDCDCILFWCDDEWAQRCYQDYTTSCSTNPSCQSGEDKQDESNC